MSGLLSHYHPGSGNVLHSFQELVNVVPKSEFARRLDKSRCHDENAGIRITQTQGEHKTMINLNDAMMQVRASVRVVISQERTLAIYQTYLKLNLSINNKKNRLQQWVQSLKSVADAYPYPSLFLSNSTFPLSAPVATLEKRKFNLMEYSTRSPHQQLKQ